MPCGFEYFSSIALLLKAVARWLEFQRFLSSLSLIVKRKEKECPIRTGDNCEVLRINADFLDSPDRVRCSRLF